MTISVFIYAIYFQKYGGLKKKLKLAFMLNLIYMSFFFKKNIKTGLFVDFILKSFFVRFLKSYLI